MKYFLLIVLSVFAITSFAQTGPGGVGNSSTNFVFMRADAGTSTTTNNGDITSWNDQSGNGNNFVQAPSPNTSKYQTVGQNGFPSVRFNGNAYLTGPNVFPTNSNYTKFIVGRISATGSGNNFFSGTSGHAIYMQSTLFPRIYDVGTFVTSTVGMTLNTFAIISATYQNTTPKAGQIFVNSNSGGSGTTNVAPTDATMHLGSHNTGNLLNGDMMEVIGYNFSLNTTQRIIVENYLSAKYDIGINATNDVYTMDTPANGNFDYDVAGIGRTSSTNLHNDARGTGFIRVLNPTDLEDGEYFMWGHNNLAALATNTSDIPASVSARFARVWRVSETGGNNDVGNIDIQIDVTGLADFSTLSACDGSSAIRLLVDTNNDGLFSDQTAIAGATNIGGNIYRFANVSAISNGNRFTIAIVRNSNGPGGVGNMATNFLFLRSDAGTSSTTNNTQLSSWSDQSGNANHALQATAGNQPIYLSNQLNGFASVDFNGSSQIMIAPNSFPVNSDYTKFVVGKIKGTGPFNNYFSGSVGSGHALFMDMGSLTPKLYQNGIFLTSSQAMTLNQFAILSNTWTHSTITGDIFVNGAAGGSAAASVANTDNAIQIGGFASGALLNGAMTEIIGYNFKLNSAQRIIVENYLSAKYGLTLTAASEKYTRDDAPFNYDYDVAGIGRVDASNQHRDARGTGRVRVSNPTNLDNGEFFMWGHNNGSLSTTNTVDVPSGVQTRMSRVWSVSEAFGDVGSVDVQFDLSGLGTIVASDLRLLIDHNGNGIFNEPGTITLSGATALACNIYSFTVISDLNNNVGFTIGSVNQIQTPLPVSLTSFTGRMENLRTVLNWTTESELNNEYFDVERSTNAENFTSIKKVDGAGTTASAHKYEAIDEFPPFGKIYYRLKQVDYNGDATYSKVIVVENNSPELRLFVTPNPVKSSGEITVTILQPDGVNAADVSFAMYDLMGRATPVAVKASGSGTWTLTLVTPESAASGIYILRVSVGSVGKSFVERILISR